MKNSHFTTLLTGFAFTSAMAAEKGTIAILVNSVDNPLLLRGSQGPKPKPSLSAIRRWCCRTAKTLSARESSSAWLSAVRFRASF